jgi:hypothetical protein
MGSLQYARWLRQLFTRSKVSLTLYEYRWPIRDMEELRPVRTAQTDAHGDFDFGDLKDGHYTLIAKDEVWGSSDWFDVEVKNLTRKTESVTLDISPHFPSCEGGHEFIIHAH